MNPRLSSKPCGSGCWPTDEIKSLRQKALRRKCTDGLVYANKQHDPTVEQVLVMLFEDHGQMTLRQLEYAADMEDPSAKKLTRVLYEAVVPCRITDSAKAASPSLFRHPTKLLLGSITTGAQLATHLGRSALDRETMLLFETDLTRSSWRRSGFVLEPHPPTPLEGFHHGVAFTNLMAEMAKPHPSADKLIGFASLLIYFWGHEDAEPVLRTNVKGLFPLLETAALKNLGPDAIQHLTTRGLYSYYTLLFGLLTANAFHEVHKEEIRQIVRLLSWGGEGRYAGMEKVLPLALMDAVLRHRGADLGESTLTDVPPGYPTPAKDVMKGGGDEVWDPMEEEERYEIEFDRMPSWVVDKHTYRGRTGEDIPRQWAARYCEDRAAFDTLDEQELEERFGKREMSGLNAFMSQGVKTFDDLHPANDPFFDTVQFVKGGTLGHLEFIRDTSFRGVMDHFAQKVADRKWFLSQWQSPPTSLPCQ